VINNLARQFLACLGIRIDDDILACAQTPQPLPLSQPREPREPRGPQEPREPQEPQEEHGIVEAALKEQLPSKVLCSNRAFWQQVITRFGINGAREAPRGPVGIMQTSPVIFLFERCCSVVARGSRTRTAGTFVRAGGSCGTAGPGTAGPSVVNGRLGPAQMDTVLQAAQSIRNHDALRTRTLCVAKSSKVGHLFGSSVPISSIPKRG
jgi:hypothetical protein